MALIDREDIHIISRNSNLSKNSIGKTLKENVYNNAQSWHKFLQLFFISLGIGFTIAGIVFFFAYNWADFHKFVKIGLIEVLLIVLTGIVVFSNFNSLIKNIVLTGASVLVGVLFAVFGQIYHTGANAYDFFLGWAVFITLWVIISGFAPLWLIYLILINTTIYFYSEQVASSWSDIILFTILFILNTSFLIGCISVSIIRKEIKLPAWFLNSIALTCIFWGTIGVTCGIFDNYKIPFLILILITALAYTAGILYGIKEKSGFYLAIIPFSVIIIISSFFIRLSSDLGMLFFVSFFIIASVTLLIVNLISIQKKWANE